MGCCQTTTMRPWETGGLYVFLRVELRCWVEEGPCRLESWAGLQRTSSQPRAAVADRGQRPAEGAELQDLAIAAQQEASTTTTERAFWPCRASIDSAHHCSSRTPHSEGDPKRCGCESRPVQDTAPRSPPLSATLGLFPNNPASGQGPQHRARLGRPKLRAASPRSISSHPFPPTPSLRSLCTPTTGSHPPKGESRQLLSISLARTYVPTYVRTHARTPTLLRSLPSCSCACPAPSGFFLTARVSLSQPEGLCNLSRQPEPLRPPHTILRTRPINCD